MRKIFILTILLATTALEAQVGIGTTTPDNSAMLEIQSTNTGVLFPRLTTAQRDAIANPAMGLLIYNTDTNSFNYNMGTPTTSNWLAIESGLRKSGSYNVGRTNRGWTYYNVTFSGEAFKNVPIITLTFREGIGTNNTGSHSIEQIKITNASTTGFTIAIYDDQSTEDTFIDWIAVPPTQ